MKKTHNLAVDIIAKKPEVLGIDGLSSEQLLSEPIKFPELRKKSQETGDLILIWPSAPKEWEVLIAEVTIGAFRRGVRERWKLAMSLDYLRNYCMEFLKSVELDLPENYTLWVRTFYVSYTGIPIWEKPFVEEIRRVQIL